MNNCITKWVGVAFVLLLVHSLMAQDPFDKLMAVQQLECSDVAVNSSQLFQRFLEQNKIDSARQLLKYWKEKCGNREPVFRARIILALIERNYDDSLIEINAINHLLNYQSRKEMIQSSNFNSYEYYKPYFGFLPIGSSFDNFTRKITRALMDTYPSTSFEYMLAEFYAGDDNRFFEKIQNDRYQDYALRQQYDARVEEYLSYPELHMSWITGIWIPTGGINQLGNHPELGFQIGAKKGKMNYDLTMTFKFGDAKNAYLARRTKSGNTQELTKDFFGGYIGFDVGRDVFMRRGNEIQILAGLALDGFDALEENATMEGESILTYNINFGIGYRYYLTNRFYLGLRTKYNIVDYTLNNVIDFTGNPITIQFVIGGLYNVHRQQNLDRLYYSRRK